MQGLTTIGGVPIQRHHLLRCHCGAVVLRLHLPDGVVSPRRCDCSMCRRRGAIVASVKLADLEIVQGQHALRLYQFNTHVADTTSAACAASTRIISAALHRTNTATTSAVWTG